MQSNPMQKQVLSSIINDCDNFFSQMSKEYEDVEKDQHLVDSSTTPNGGRAKLGYQDNYDFLMGGNSDDESGELDDLQQFRSNNNGRVSYEEFKKV